VPVSPSKSRFLFRSKEIDPDELAEEVEEHGIFGQFIPWNAGLTALSFVRFARVGTSSSRIQLSTSHPICSSAFMLDTSWRESYAPSQDIFFPEREYFSKRFLTTRISFVDICLKLKGLKSEVVATPCVINLKQY